MTRIPYELVSLPRWIRWESREVGGKTSKVPVTVDGTKGASTTDASTWTTFEAVRPFARKGFVFSKQDGLLGIDLDHVLLKGKPTTMAYTIVSEANSYTEVSPSGTGLHIIGKGAKPKWLPNRIDLPGDSAVECYDHSRYFTITGQIFEGHDKLRWMDAESLFAFLKALYHTPQPSTTRRSKTSTYQISINAVVPGVREGKRVSHPFHDSVTGTNFMVDKGGLTWRCWRHSVTGNALHLLGIKFGIIDCGDKLTKEQWRQILRVAHTERLAQGLPNIENRVLAEADWWLRNHGY